MKIIGLKLLENKVKENFKISDWGQNQNIIQMNAKWSENNKLLVIKIELILIRVQFWSIIYKKSK